MLSDTVSLLSEPPLPHLPFSCCVILGKFPNLSEAQWLQLKNGAMPMRCLGHSQHVLSVSDHSHLHGCCLSVPLEGTSSPTRPGFPRAHTQGLAHSTVLTFAAREQAL